MLILSHLGVLQPSNPPDKIFRLAKSQCLGHFPPIVGQCSLINLPFEMCQRFIMSALKKLIAAAYFPKLSVVLHVG